MMSQRSLPSKPALQDESQSSGTRKTTSTRQPDQQALKCPRCDSTNTKFCYYNNYSLTQPRHFCKTCRRYWTKGGALRNVPIGGGCRKNKKVKSSSKLTIGDSPRSSTSGFGGMKFFNGVSPSIDFQLGGGGLSFPRSCFPLDQTGSPNYTFMGLNYNNSLPSGNGECHLGPVIHQNVHQNLNVDNTSLASSIESLSSLNQDLHWKLQQQRLAMLFGDEQNSSQKDQTQKLLQPILFQNLEVPKQDSCFSSSVNPRKESTATGDATTEWFFGNSYAGDQMTTNTPRNIGRNASGSGWNGVQAWEDLHQYTALP